MLEGYGSLFAGSFLAATVLPGSSEALLLALAVTGRFDSFILILVASAGNVLGSAVNWALGYSLQRWKDYWWLPVKADQLDHASKLFARYGLWTLLLAWLPVVGDPLTVIAGVFRVRFFIFLALVALGKTARYVGLLAAAHGISTWVGV